MLQDAGSSVFLLHPPDLLSLLFLVDGESSLQEHPGEREGNTDLLYLHGEEQQEPLGPERGRRQTAGLKVLAAVTPTELTVTYSPEREAPITRTLSVPLLCKTKTNTHSSSSEDIWRHMRPSPKHFLLLSGSSKTAEHQDSLRRQAVKYLSICTKEQRLISTCPSQMFHIYSGLMSENKTHFW